MIISEKQIHALMKFTRDHIEDLKSNRLTEAGKLNLKVACNLLTEVMAQQPEELKEIN